MSKGLKLIFGRDECAFPKVVIKLNGEEIGEFVGDTIGGDLTVFIGEPDDEESDKGSE